MNNIINNLIQILQTGNNPQNMVNQFANQNPQVNGMLNQMRQSGMSPKEFVMQYARQNNLDISPILNILNNRGIKL